MRNVVESKRYNTRFMRLEAGGTSWVQPCVKTGRRRNPTIFEKVKFSNQAEGVKVMSQYPKADGLGLIINGKRENISPVVRLCTLCHTVLSKVTRSELESLV